MPIYLKKSTTSQEIPLGVFVDDTDGKTAETGLSIANTDILLWKSGGTTLPTKNSGGATHISGGIYYAVLDDTDTNTTGPMIIFVHKSGALPVRVECVVLEANVYDSLIGATDTLDVTLANGAHGGASGSLTLGAGATISNASGSALTLTSSGSNGSGLVATGNGSGHGISATGGATGNGFKLLGGATSGAGLDVRSQGGTGSTNYAAYFKGNATGADTGGIYAAGGTTGGDGIEAVGTGNGHGLYVVGAGTGEGLHATGGAAANGHGAHFEGVGTNSHGLLLTRGGAGGDDLAFGNSDCTIPVVTTVNGLAANTITATAIATGAIDADAIAADAGTEIGTAVWATATRVLTANTNLNDPTAAAIADAVWDELATGHTDAGKAGEQLWTDLDAVLVDTAEIGAAGAGLTNINLPDQTMNITGNITGNLSGSVGSVTGAVGSVTGAVGSVTGAVGSVTGNVGGNVTGSIGSLATQAKADVNAEVADVITTDTVAELAGVPAANAALATKIAWLALLARNKITQTATLQTAYADNGSSVVAIATVSDDTTTFTRQEWS